jgi:hypothetical protein
MENSEIFRYIGFNIDIADDLGIPKLASLKSASTASRGIFPTTHQNGGPIP